MAKIKNYTDRLRSLQSRRSDDILNKSILSESFGKKEIPETVKYVFESMSPIDREYTLNTYKEAERVQNQILKNLAPGVSVSFEYQGSVPLNTHIKLHSDLDILVLHGNFFSLEPPLKPTSIYQGDPDADLKSLRNNVYRTLADTFPKAIVDNSKGKAIAIEGGSLSRKFDVIICNWLHTDEYSTDKARKGIMLYDKTKDKRLKDFPFTHIAQVDAKDKALMESNYRRVIRLLKNLKVDATPNINLSSFMITSIMYHMSNTDYNVTRSNSTRLLVNTSKHLQRIIEDEAYRKSLESPNKREKLFAENDSQKVEQVKRLKKELDETIQDLVTDLAPYSSVLYDYGQPSVTRYYDILEKGIVSY